jgi:hypothetical protein
MCVRWVAANGKVITSLVRRLCDDKGNTPNSISEGTISVKIRLVSIKTIWEPLVTKTIAVRPPTT